MKKILRLMPYLNLLAAVAALCALLVVLVSGGGVFGMTIVGVIYGPLLLYGLVSAKVMRLFECERLPLMAEIAFICLSLLAAGLSLPLKNYLLLALSLINLLVLIYSHLPDGGPSEL